MPGHGTARARPDRIELNQAFPVFTGTSTARNGVSSGQPAEAATM